MKNKKGFTLMEILFVVLLIALIVSFAMPAIRNVRFSIKNAQAKAALRKLAEAAHSYYEYSRGERIFYQPEEGIQSAHAKEWATLDCNNRAASGTPATGGISSNASQLFACGFLDWKDFAGLPYQFYICNTIDDTKGWCVGTNGAVAYVSARGINKKSAGEKYSKEDGYLMYIMPDSKEVLDTAE